MKIDYKLGYGYLRTPAWETEACFRSIKSWANLGLKKFAVGLSG
jgi:hypothetical protein